MKRLLTFFTLSLLVVACDTQPAAVDTVDAQFAKTGKPDNPNKPQTPSSCESIAFTGHLQGSADVEGCCPNAGPFPAYTMTLSEEAFPAGLSGEHEGNIFMNSLGRRVPGDYIVQFWWGESPDDYFLEIRGGEVTYDKRARLLTVRFENESMTIYHADDEPTSVNVTFTLTREPAG
ncbi:MAG: hypothetical protein LJF04_17885 [Gemmatimonadetes bacterium]|nr:hypothetical protein [Gemmatimonadota bacterium]